MIVIEDVTEQRLLEKQLSEARKEYESNLELLNNVMNLNSSELFSFLQECDHIMETVESISSNSEIDNDTVNKIFRGVHSLKGGASTLNFSNLSEIAHTVEDYLDDLRRETESADSKDIKSKVADIKNELNNIYSVVNRFNIQKHSHTPDVEKTVTINISDLDSIRIQLDETRDPNIGISLIEDLKMIPLNQCEATLQNMVMDLTEKLDKKAALTITSECKLPYELFNRLSNPLIHLVRNSLDHGIESASEREKKGKNDIATIMIKSEEKDDQYVISIEDDGQGIQAEKVKDVALKKNLIKPDADMSEEELIDLIFHPGLSTKNVVTEISGRGVGLDSVKHTIEELGGSLEVKNKKDFGTVFIIKIPSLANKGAA